MKVINHILLLVLILPYFPLMAQNRDYAGAEIRTNESFLYGRFEVNMKSCKGSGISSAFFTFYDMPGFDKNWNEIDIEILGRYENEVQFNAIVGLHEMHEHRKVLSFNPHNDFHTYSFDWTPDYIAWSVDGNEVYRQVGEHIKRMDAPQKIMMNLWASDFIDWTGPFDDSILPVETEYDYVNYYVYDLLTKTFTLKWTDDFKRFDMNRWSLANHTFEGNKVDFTPDNVDFRKGILILKLSKKEARKAAEVISEEKSTEGKGEILKAEIVSDSVIRITFKGDTYALYARKKNFKLNGMEILKTKLSKNLRTVDIYLASPIKETQFSIWYSPPGMDAQIMKVIK